MKRYRFIFLPVLLCAAVSCDLTENPNDDRERADI